MRQSVLKRIIRRVKKGVMHGLKRGAACGGKHITCYNADHSAVLNMMQDVIDNKTRIARPNGVRGIIYAGDI